MKNELRFAVQTWTERNGSLEAVIARSSNIVVARAAFEAAKEEYPDAYITLSQGGRLLKSSDRDA